METDASVPNERQMWPILSFPQLKLDPDEENDSKVFSWHEDGKVIDYLEIKGEKNNSNDEFIEPTPIGRIKNEVNQKKSDLCKEIRNFKKVQVKSDDKNIDNDVMEPCAIKKETIDVNEAVEEFNYMYESAIKTELIEQEDLHIKHEEDNEDVLKSRKNYDNQCPSIQREDLITSKEEDKKKQKKKSRKPENQLMLHQCPECSYRCTRKSNLKMHLVKHKTPEDIVWYNCQECSYKASLKTNLKIHVRLHDKNKLILKCSKCSYETWAPTYLKRHQKRHQEENGMGWHKCLLCTYTTPYKYHLQQHILSHKSKEKLKKKTRQPENQMMLHQYPDKRVDEANLDKQISHKSADEIRWFECSQCQFKTVYKNNLILHQIKHKAQEIEWFICYECSFKTKRKAYLRRHIMSKHRKEINKGYQ